MLVKKLEQSIDIKDYWPRWVVSGLGLSPEFSKIVEMGVYIVESGNKEKV